MIEATQSARPAKPTRAARKTAPKHTRTKPLTKGQRLVAALEALSFTPPPGYDWKKDREQYLREKYENIR